jgi:hypothetical protein
MRIATAGGQARSALRPRTIGPCGHETTTVTWKCWMPLQCSASPHRARSADTSARPAATARYRAVMVPHPAPGTQLGADTDAGVPTEVSTAEVRVVNIQYVLSRLTSSSSPTWAETVVLFAVRLSRIVCGAADVAPDRVDDVDDAGEKGVGEPDVGAGADEVLSQPAMSTAAPNIATSGERTRRLVMRRRAPRRA